MTAAYDSISSARHISVTALALAGRVYLALSLVIALLASVNSANAADDAAQYKQSQGLAVYLGSCQRRWSKDMTLVMPSRRCTEGYQPVRTSIICS